MGAKERVLEQIDPAQAWAELFPGWKEGVNVPCVVASENHESGADENPSLSLSVDGKAYCHACGYKATSVVGVLADKEQLAFKDALREAYNLFVAPLVPESYVADCHQALLRDEYMRAVVEERRGLSAATIKKFELGWDKKKRRLVIPVRDEHGWCVNTRLHDTMGVHPPEMKILSYGKGYGSARLWPQWQVQLPGPVFVFEGELDAMLAHSQGLPALSVTGGASTWKEEWTKALRGRRVYVVPDMDKAGMKGADKKVESLGRKCKVSVVKLHGMPGGKDGKDFTDWVVKHGRTGKELLEMAEEAESVEPTKEQAEEVAQEGLEAFDELSAKERQDLLRSEATWKWLRSRGAFFKSQALDLFYAREGGSVYKVGEKVDGFAAMLGSQVSWAINTATTSGKFVIKHIVHRGTAEARASTAGSWSLYTEAGAIYMHCGADKLLMARGGELTIVKNALNDEGVLLECPAQIQDFEPVLDADPDEAVRMLWDECFRLFPVSETDKLLTMCWWIGLFVKEYVRPKPLLRFMARTAYGKSTTTKMMSLITYGEEVLQNSATTTAALYSIAKQFPVLFHDNVETRNMTPQFDDFMLTAATGGGKSKRQMNTDQGVIWENTNCLIVTNGIEPVSKREIVSRTAEVALDLAKYGSKNFHETSVFDAIKKDRAYIISGLLKKITRDMVPRMRTGEVQRIAKELGSHAKNRFDEYLGIMAVGLDMVWPVLKPAGFARPNDVVNAWLKSQTEATEEQDEGTNEVLYFLNELAERGPSIPDVRTRPEVQKDGSLAMQASTRQLFTDSRVIARALNGKCPWQNERQLGTRIVDAYTVLVKSGWTHRKKVVNGRSIHELRRQGVKEDKVRGVAQGGVPVKGVQVLDVHPRRGAAVIPSLRSVRAQGVTKGARKGR
jgi:hypothetical protein